MTLSGDHPAITKFLRRLDVVLEPLDEAERLSVLATHESRVRQSLGPVPPDAEVEATIAEQGPVEHIADPIIAAAGMGPTWEVPFEERESDVRRDRFRGVLTAGAGAIALAGVLFDPHVAVLLSIVALVFSLGWLLSAGSERRLLQIGLALSAFALIANVAFLKLGLDAGLGGLG